MEKIIATLKSVLAKLKQQWYLPYFLILVHIVIGSSLVYASPRSTIAFLFLLTALLSIYYFKVKPVFKGLAIAILLLGIMPVLGLRNIFYLEVIFQISVFAALALGLNIVVGFAGLLNLGYAAFYAVGAYLWGFFGSQQMFLLNETPGTAPVGTPFFLPQDYFYLFLILGAIVASIVGLLLGLPVLRVRGDYLAIVTLGFGEVIRVLANNLDKPLNFTNGPQGITPIQRPTLAPEFVEAFNNIFSGVIGRPVSTGELYNVLFYVLSLIIVGIIIVVARNLEDSKMGRAWTAIREDETAAIAMGIPLVKMKLSAFAVGASFAGTMGVLVAASRTFVSPESFSFMQSIGVLVMVILGGIGSIPGVILGAAVVTILNLQILQGLSLYLSQLRQSDAIIPLINFAWADLSTQLDPAKYQRLLFGLILILMMIFRPAGLIPAERRKRETEETKPE
ncbi:MAG TPA: branched-chain amino acid ABC transporter permease [Anaerolineae bacterium]|jgi:branched-chain amino acid transport system permease protein|nr:branched-chain amino acid ABC transporter permease [Anaerolineae bacterium]